jgi:hypothetical protein
MGNIFRTASAGFRRLLWTDDYAGNAGGRNRQHLALGLKKLNIFGIWTGYLLGGDLMKHRLLLLEPLFPKPEASLNLYWFWNSGVPCEL